MINRHAEGAVVAVAAQPGARRDAVLGLRGDALRISVTALPERGRANEAIIRLLAGLIGCRGSEVRLLAGGGHRSKKFLVVGLDVDEVRDRLDRHLSLLAE